MTATKKTKLLPPVWMRVNRFGFPLLSSAAWRKSAVGWNHDVRQVARFALAPSPPSPEG